MTRTIPVLSDFDETTSSEGGFGALETSQGRLPLIAVDVRALVSGLSAQTTVSQTFRNSTDAFLEATYIFPLPDRASVTSFELFVAGRRVTGLLKERGEARADYDQAIRKGHRAAIAEEERPGVFSIRVGNLPPHETVQVRLALVGPLPVCDGEATFRFPLVVAPRYTPGIPLDGESVGLGTTPDTDHVPDASRVTPPLLLPGFPNPVRLTLEVQLDLHVSAESSSGSIAAHWLAGLRSSLHATVMEAQNLLTVRLQPGERLNRDFILRFPVSGEELRTSLRFQKISETASHVFALTIVPPRMPAAAKPTPRDVVFVLDRSGSMEGWKMVAARRAIARMVDSLLDHDRFTVLAFDNSVDWPPEGKCLMTATNRLRWRTLEWLGKVDARGGTEMEPALTAAMGLWDADSSGRDRAIVFVTDGQVTGEDRLLKTIKKYGQALPRMYCVGVDQAVNAAFLKRLSDLGNGHCELVESEDRLDHALANINRLIGQPVLTHLRLIAPEGGVTDLAPATLPDVYVDRPVTIYGRVNSHRQALRLLVSAHHPDGSDWLLELIGDVARRTSLSDQTSIDSANTLLAEWGRARVRDLEDRYVCTHGSEKSVLAQQIVAASLESHTLSRFTAYVAVDDSEIVNAGGLLNDVLQPVELPQGSKAAMAGGAALRIVPMLGKRMSRGFAASPLQYDSSDEDLFDEEEFQSGSVDSMIFEFTETAIDMTQVKIEPDALPIIRLVDLILNEAISHKANEVLIELNDNSFEVFHIENGRTVSRDSPPRRLFHPIMQRLCQLAKVQEPQPNQSLTAHFEYSFGPTKVSIQMLIDRTGPHEKIVLSIVSVNSPASSSAGTRTFWK